MQPQPRSTPLEGEDIQTEHWQDARHWVSIYGDLVRFKRNVLERVQRELVTLPDVARKAATEDVQFIERQMSGYYDRLDAWYRRLWALQGLWVDEDERIVRYLGHEERLTNRELQLLQYLLEHPHRFATTERILAGAWQDSTLSPEEVRNYILRLRRMLTRLEIPCDIVNRPGHGYSLVFRSTD
jgi:DNA-binding response OmpR family regulator